MSLESVFKENQKEFFADLQSDEICTLALNGEETDFVRFNGSRVRQSLALEQGSLSIQFVKGAKSVNLNIPFTKNSEQNKKNWVAALSSLRQKAESLPEDPFLVKPKNNGQSHEVHKGDLLMGEALVEGVLSPAGEDDMAGVAMSGSVFRGNANSLGQLHWFETESFSVDYSFYDSSQNAVKGSYAGSDWNSSDYGEKLAETRRLLQLMNRPRKKVERGEYKTYLAPGAVDELLGMLSWGGVSRAAYEMGHCALEKLFKGEKKLNAKINLWEDFSLGLVPRFNEQGEVFVEKMPIIERGENLQLLTSTRTAKEFNLESQFASSSEGLRSDVLEGGGLKKGDILKELGTGLYISNLHYLNWSEVRNARVTGMTRYACFWVENGEIVAPITDLRFDESFFNFFGERLLDLTDFSEIHPSVMTYSQRSIGGGRCPGALVDGFTFTL